MNMSVSTTNNLSLTLVYGFRRPRVLRKRAKEKEQVSTKIVVRNVPFETNEKEIRELFR